MNQTASNPPYVHSTFEIIDEAMGEATSPDGASPPVAFDVRVEGISTLGCYAHTTRQNI